MGTALALCGAMAGWGVTVLVTRQRVAVLRVRCADAEAENVRWRQAHSGRAREPAEGPAAPRDREPAAGAGTDAGTITGAGTGAGASADGDTGADFTERAFVNIGRRVQAIVHKQLGDLSEMQERHGGDPAMFADLMRLDHATALIGRFADSLVVLAGERPGRQWSEPVPVFSVLRGAMSRIVDYRRVELAEAPQAELAGTAVEAVVHALAELLDNATRYSPPDSPVALTARRTAGGIMIEVVDAGVGLAPQAAEHVARVLADPGAPGLDLADVGGSPRLGLAVIGRLAHTVGFQASVRPSAAGGVKAQLFLPEELVLVGAATAPVAPRVSGSAGRAPADDARTSDEPGVRANGTADGRPGGLPQRRRRPPTAPPTVARTVRVPGVNDRDRGPFDAKSGPGPGADPGAGPNHGPGPGPGPGSGSSSGPEPEPGPGQWLDAFRGGPAASPGDDDDRERGAAS
ncbi:anti-sigma regulatory factor (Ser/Thr protein kinase) [Catenulispora sp. GP43]|uniref:sensor histidine kinase n=1 Tax=Catenulispora sp. GP43 TaxID=3156263 RepID=UPI0035113E4E